MMVVLPVLSERLITKRERINNRVDFASIPRESGIPVYIDTSATTGIVNPTLASADPIERFRLFCN